MTEYSLDGSVRQKTEEPGKLEKICAKLSCSRAEVPTSL